MVGLTKRLQLQKINPLKDAVSKQSTKLEPYTPIVVAFRKAVKRQMTEEGNDKENPINPVYGEEISLT